MQFLQANASLIFFGIALLLMFYMHSGRGHSMGGSGGGCGMGHQHDESAEHDQQHGARHQPDAMPIEPPIETWGSGDKKSATPVAAGSDHRSHGGGCH